MLEQARIQASVTHDSYEGGVVSQVTTFAMYYFVNKSGEKEELFDYVCQQKTRYSKITK
jgi:ADP-ribosyl-[dinitrogen reductase] hydrolase